MTECSDGTRCWGIYRELAHSPGRETDDALVLQAVARVLSEKGFTVELKTTEDLRDGGAPPAFLFVMCERDDALERLAGWEEAGACVVNGVEAIRNTYRDRTLTRMEEAGVPLPKSALVRTADREPRGPAGDAGLAGLWVKRGDVHNTQPGDVLRAATTDEARAALAALSRRGIPTAVLQEHAEGDLVKFYGVGSATDSGEEPGWFEWFYHRDQPLRRHPFDAASLATIARRAAAALGLEVWGGDAIVAASGKILLIDLNAWPSFALYREEAARRIADRLAACFSKHGRTRVAE